MHSEIQEILVKVFGSVDSKIIETAKDSTNHNFIVEIKNTKYFLRYPNKKISQIIDYKQELKNLNLVAENGLTKPKIYADTEGVILTEYFDNAEITKLDDEFIIQSAKLLSELHHLKPEFKNIIDPFEAFDKYVKISSSNKLVVMQDQMQVLLKEYNQLPKILVNCHNDPNIGNFLKFNGKLLLIDFEYSGQNDPAFDIAYLFSYSKFNSKQEELFFKNYISNFYNRDVWRQKIYILKKQIMLLDLAWKSI